MSVTTAGPSTPAMPTLPSAGRPLGTLQQLLVGLVPLLQALLTVLGVAALVIAVASGPQGLPLPLYVFVLAVPAGFAARG